MSKRLVQQRRGKGSPTFKASRNAFGRLFYPVQKNGEKIIGEIVELRHDTTKSSVLAEVLLFDSKRAFVVAGEGVFVGQRIEMGESAGLEIGNVLFLKDVTEGAPVFNIEIVPGDGGKICRASGSFALVLSRDKGTATVKTRAGKMISVSSACRATVGIAAGGGRIEKPLVKAGAKFHLMKAKKRFWPIVRGVAMNVITHPFGGSQHHPGKSKSTSRHAPPGRKVGAIASKRTGRRKKK